MDDGVIILVAEQLRPALLEELLHHEETHQLHLDGPTTEAARRREAACLVDRLGAPPAADPGEPTAQRRTQRPATRPADARGAGLTALDHPGSVDPVANAPP